MAQTVDEATVAYFKSIGWLYATCSGQFWTEAQDDYTYLEVYPHKDHWRAVIRSGDSDLVCTGPDPITCFITAELMNWSNPDA